MNSKKWFIAYLCQSSLLQSDLRPPTASPQLVYSVCAWLQSLPCFVPPLYLSCEPLLSCTMFDKSLGEELGQIPAPPKQEGPSRRGRHSRYGPGRGPALAHASSSASHRAWVTVYLSLHGCALLLLCKAGGIILWEASIEMASWRWSSDS